MLLLLVVFPSNRSTSGNHIPPPGNTCERTGKGAVFQVQCYRVNFQTILSSLVNVTSSVTGLELQHANIHHLNRRHLKRRHLKHFENLSILKLLDCDIDTIDADAFHNLTKLTDITLERNNIRQLHPYMFSPLEKLLSLTIHEHLLGSLPDYVFYGLRKLQRLG